MDTPPKEKNAFQSFKEWSASSVTLKILSIGSLVLIMLIPLNMVEGIIHERMWRGTEVAGQIASEWAEGQTLVGPVLRIPYLVNEKTSKTIEGKQVVEVIHTRRMGHFLPEKTEIIGVLKPDRKHRGIYSVPIYTGAFAYTGHFGKPDFGKWNEEKTVLWEEAEVLFGIWDKKGLQNALTIKWNDETYRVESLPESTVLGSAGVVARVAASEETPQFDFSFDLEIRGSKSVYFAPTAAETQMEISSTWPDPAFKGAFLPDPNQPGPGGFKAQWNITDLNHGFPLQFNESLSLTNYNFGVELFEPMNLYTLSERAVKYGILVIVLTFAAFFFIQVMTGKRIHFIQYLLVGLALSVFYVLLLSLAEVLEFKFAYGLASLAVLALSGFYMVNILLSVKSGLRTNLIIAAVYLFVFVIIQMEQYALLAGSIGLFAVLAVVMAMTRKVDWYHMKKRE